MGTKLYEEATAVLKHIFDHDEGHIITFSLKVKERAEEMGLSTEEDDILTVRGSTGIDKNLITKYSQFTLSDIRNSVTCYHLQQTRAN